MATTSTVIYTTLIGDDEPVEELQAEIISYGYRLNRPGSISFSMAIDHPLCRRDVIDPGKHEVVVERNKAIVWRGPVLTAAEDAKKVDFGGAGMLAYLDRWFLTSSLQTANHPDPVAGATVIGQDSFQMARALLDHHLDKAGAGFNIDTSGADLSGVLRDHTYFPGQNIGQSLQQLGERQNGFDFDIDHESRLFRLHYPRQGTRQVDLVWEDGIREFTRGLDATNQASQIIGLGLGEGDAQVKLNRQDSSAVSEYKLTQRVYSDPKVSIQSTLEGHVVRELAYHKNPPQSVGVTIGTSAFNPFTHGLGVEGRLIFPSPYGAVSEFRRLTGFDIEWRAGDERAVLWLAPVVSF